MSDSCWVSSVVENVQAESDRSGAGPSAMRPQVRVWLTDASVSPSVKWGCSESIHHIGHLRMPLLMIFKQTVSSSPLENPKALLSGGIETLSPLLIAVKKAKLPLMFH